VLAIGGSIIGGIALELLLKVEVFKFLVDVLLWIWKLFTGEIKTNLIWLVLIFFLGGFLVFIYYWLKNSLAKEVVNEEMKNEPEFLRYVQDDIKGLLYRWNYSRDFTGKYEVRDLHAYCPSCKCALVDERCPICETNYEKYWLDPIKVKAIIHNRAEYPQKRELKS